MNLNLENPIFVIYVNIHGIQDSNVFDKFRQHFTYQNCTTWILPVEGETKIELIWQGTKYSSDPGIVTQDPALIKYLHEIIEVIIVGTEDHQIKQSLRDLKLKKIFT